MSRQRNNPTSVVDDTAPTPPSDHVEEQSRFSGVRVSEWPMRRKVGLVLTIPMALAVAFGGLRVHDAWLDQQAFAATASQVSVLSPAVDYLYAAERASVVIRGVRDTDSPKVQAELDKVTAAADDLEAARLQADLTPEQDVILDRAVLLSAQLRDQGGYVSLLQSVTQVRQLHNGVADFFESVTNEQLEPEPHMPQLAAAMNGRLSFTMQQLQTAYSGTTVQNPAELQAELGVEGAAIEQLSRSRGLDDAFTLGLVRDNATRFGAARAGAEPAAPQETFAQYDALTSEILEDAALHLGKNTNAAQVVGLVTAVGTAAALLAAIVLALLVSRLLVNPVRRVRDEALAVAHDRLPAAVAKIRAGQDPGEIEPIAVSTHEETGQLARAVDDMHRTAVRLALGEADLRAQVSEMFVTLSRRSTSLINQQLGLIEDLERDEQDPRRLESLFRLDHLAARMRRTSESLVILSGSAQRSRDTSPIAVADALQAATAGVRDYQRVELRGSSADQVVGSAASDIVHLLTEIIDNALSYSPPNAPVNVSTTSAPGQSVISVSDAGLGMTEEMLVEINEMLTTDSAVSPDTARRMGLFVVSRLARRHGVKVSLEKNGRGGITATIVLPSTLLVGSRRATLSAVSSEAPGASTSEVAAVTTTSGPVPHEPDHQVDQIVAAINAVSGLPQRRPGSTSTSRTEAVTPHGSGDLFSRAAEPQPFDTPESVPAEPMGETPKEPAAQVDDDPNDESVIQLFERRVPHGSMSPNEDGDATEDTELALEDSEADEFQQPEFPEAVVTGDADAAAEAEPASEQGPETIDEPVPSLWAQNGTSPSASDPLTQPWSKMVDESPTPTHSAAEEPEDDKGSIFAQLSSNWMSPTDSGSWTSPEVDAGWQAADGVTDPDGQAAPLTEAGLPMRQPGTRLIPGGVAPAQAPTLRDPEAIRKRLSAHADGVNRGRAAHLTPVSPHEEAGPA